MVCHSNLPLVSDDDSSSTRPCSTRRQQQQHGQESFPSVGNSAESTIWNCVPYLDLSSISYALAIMGLFFHETQQYENSFTAYRDVLLIQQKVHGEQSVECGNTWHTLGLVCFKIGNCEEQAMRCFQNSLACYAKQPKAAEKYRIEIANCLFNIGYLTSEKTKDSNVAIHFYNESLRLRQNTQSPEAVSGALHTFVHIGRLHERDGNLETAVEYLQGAIGAALASGPEHVNLDFLTETLNHIGNLRLQIGDTTGMMQAYSDALRLLRLIGKDEDSLDIRGMDLYHISRLHPQCARIA